MTPDLMTAEDAIWCRQSAEMIDELSDRAFTASESRMRLRLRRILATQEASPSSRTETEGAE